LQEREKTKTKRKEKRLQLKNKVLKDLENIGIWKDKNTIEENLAKFRTKTEKLAAQKSQHLCHFFKSSSIIWTFFKVLFACNLFLNII
jgi:hypothetical protein